MKYLTLIMVLLASLAIAEVPEDMILIHEVTEETYEDFLGQYSESCRPNVTRWVGAASLAAARFNEGNYSEASAIVNRHVKPGDFERRTGSAAIMFSDDCNLDDLVLTLAQSEALMPMMDSISCMVRVSESDRDWKRAASIMDPEDPDSLIRTLQYIENAMYGVDDVMEDGACEHLPTNLLDNIIAVRIEWERVRDQLNEIMEMPTDVID